MPHQCTECGRTFPDGSKEMLSGCPDCGGNKFQFDPKGSGGGGGSGGGRSTGTDTAGTRPDGTDTADGRSGGNDDTDATGRSWPTYGDEPDSIIGSRHAEETRGRDGGAADADRDDGIIEANETPTEDSAQAAARSGFAGPFEVDDGGAGDDDPEASDTVAGTTEAAADAGANGPPVDEEGGTVVDESDESTADRPDLSELREELNEQFESIRIKSPGHYELNLMELYDREEYIISLKEDGRYVIEVPETWRSGPDED